VHERHDGKGYHGDLDYFGLQRAEHQPGKDQDWERCGVPAWRPHAVARSGMVTVSATVETAFNKKKGHVRFSSLFFFFFHLFVALLIPCLLRESKYHGLFFLTYCDRSYHSNSYCSNFLLVPFRRSAWPRFPPLPFW